MWAGLYVVLGIVLFLVMFVIGTRLNGSCGFAMQEKHLGCISLIVFLIAVAVLTNFFGLRYLLHHSRSNGKTFWTTVFSVVMACILALSAAHGLNLLMGFHPDSLQGIVKVDKDIIEQMRKSFFGWNGGPGELLIFNKLSIDALPNTDHTMYMGIYNTNNETRCHSIVFSCVTPLRQGTVCSDVGDKVIVGGRLPHGINNSVKMFDKPWIKGPSPVDIPGNELGVYPVVTNIGNRRNNTFLMEVVVYQGTNDCSTDSGGEWKEWQRKQFYLKVK